MEDTLTASQALQRQVETLRASGRLLSDIELIRYQEKKLSSKRRCIVSVQRLCVKGLSGKNRSNCVQVGKTGGLAWNILDNTGKCKDDSDNENSVEERFLKGLNRNGENDDHIYESDFENSQVLAFSSKTRPRSKNTKYRIDGRVLNDDIARRRASLHHQLEEEEIASSQKPTYSFKMRQMESKAIIKENETKAEESRQKDMRERNLALNPYAGTGIPSSRMVGGDTKPTTRPVFRLSRRRGKNLNFSAQEKQHVPKTRLDLPKPPEDFIVNMSKEVSNLMGPL